MNILQAMDDPAVFGQHFRDASSWTNWKAFLAALFALPMTAEMLADFQDCTGRQSPPTAPANEGWLICGRRSGKSFILALVAVFLACFRDWRRHLGPGERATIMIIAADRRQARTIMRYTLGLLRAVPMLSRLIVSERIEVVDLSNRVSIEIHTASFRTTRGYTIVAGLCDELAFWPHDETSAQPDREVLAALRPGMATVPGAILLCASSPYAKRGTLFDAHRRHFGKDNDPILVWQAPTREMNPTVPTRIIEDAMVQDVASARSEYFADFRSDIETFISREQVEACVEWGVRERPPVLGKNVYQSFVDSSGGSSDAMTCAIGHMEGETVVFDALREICAPFDPHTATDEFVQLFKRYGICRTHGDRYAAEWTAQAFEKRGISYRYSELPRSGLYLNLLPHLNSNTVQLLDHPRAINQITSLERRTHRGSRDSIDHPAAGHDDIANAIAGVVYVAALQRKGIPPRFGTYAPGYIKLFEEGSKSNIANPQSPPCTINFPQERQIDERHFKIIRPPRILVKCNTQQLPFARFFVVSGESQMTAVGRLTQRMPRGRQTIRKNGSLLGYHGPVSRRIKLWTFDPKPNTTVALLERAYFKALECVDRMEERREKNAASGRLTEEGMKADAFQFARNELLPQLNRARETVSRTKAELAQRRANRNHQHGDEMDELEEAIAAAGSAVESAYEEVQLEARISHNHSAQ